MLGCRTGVAILALALLTVVVPVATSPTAAANDLILVTTTADTVDGGDGLLSLREAVIQANGTAGTDTIELNVSSTYQLTRCDLEASTLDATTADLDATDPAGLTVHGNGATIIQTCAEDEDGHVFTLDGGGTFTLADATVTGWFAGIQAVASHVVLTGVTLSDSFVGLLGMGTGDGYDADLTDSVVTGNRMGVASITGDLELLRTVATGNGNAINGVEGSTTLTESEVSDSDDTGIFDVETITLERSRIVGNGGFGLDVTKGDVMIDRSTIAGNASGGLFAHVDPHDRLITVADSTISGNGFDDSPQRGGGIQGDGLLLVTESTITGNTGDVGGIAMGDGDAWIFGSTVAGNVGTDVDEVESAEFSAGAAIVGDEDSGSPNCDVGAGGSVGWSLDADDTCGLHMVTDMIGVDPLLGPLADNGGRTLTRLPSFVSPVVDALIYDPDVCGEPPQYDQRGVTRPQGIGCDPGSVEVELPSGAPHFSDVGLVHTFFWEIECLRELGATEGFVDGTFQPARTITRQGMVAWLWRLAGEPGPAGAPQFSDVPPDHPFADPIAWATEEGVVTGFADGTFRPGSPVSRQAAAAWMWRLAGEPDAVGPPSFPDVPASSAFADAIAWMAELGITEGYPDGTFRPASSITRQAVAAWVCRDDALTA